jgi:metal-responsive CopG/Arc/MetJ family transcriptional regulator
MSDFIPVDPKIKKDHLFIRLPHNVTLALDEASKKTGVNRSEIVRQMIMDCLTRMGIPVERKI